MALIKCQYKTQSDSAIDADQKWSRDYGDLMYLYRVIVV